MPANPNANPNVLLIMVDHWPAALFGGAGHPAMLTPALDELARCGVRFSNAYSECPVCIPARRSLMTGLSPRTHSDRVFKETLTMPAAKTMGQAFRDAGYQANAVGKLHVYPQRDRIGFDDVILDEEGRAMYGVTDDYDMYLGDVGYAGRQYDHGMSNNQYHYRPWHLPEETHATNWATRNMTRSIKRRDPTRPAFWFLSYRHPHPPLVPLQVYLDLYRDTVIPSPVNGSWVEGSDDLPFAVQAVRSRRIAYSDAQLSAGLRAFYALCTHIDHQIRVLIGTLREEGILDDTIICFTSDHGDMLGDHGMLAKRLMYEGSANIPMLLIGTAKNSPVPANKIDDRLVCLRDVMPTLLDLCGIEVPKTVEGRSMLSEDRREWFYGECSEGDHATRMVHDGRFKLIYYAVGNCRQLFDIDADPREMNDLAADPNHAETLEHLTDVLIGELYGEDKAWIVDGKLVGLPNKPYVPGPNRSLTSQRGDRWPAPPKVNIGQIEWHSQSDTDEAVSDLT